MILLLMNPLFKEEAAGSAAGERKVLHRASGGQQIWPESLAKLPLDKERKRPLSTCT